MNKDELIEYFVKRMEESKSELFAEIEAEKLIKKLDSKVNKATERRISKATKIDILTKVKDKLNLRLLEEAQESEYLLSNFDDVINYLKPAVNILDARIQALKTSSEKEGLSNEC